MNDRNLLSTILRIFQLGLFVLFLNAGCGGSPDSPEVKLERARILMEREQAAEAIPLLNEVVAAAPKNPEARYQRGVAYESLDVLEKALVDYTECLAMDAERTDALNNKAVVLARMRRFEEAAAEFTRLVDLDPQGSLAYRNRGLCHFDLKQYDAALADYAKALELAPDDASNWYQRAGVYLEQKRFEEAEQDYSKAIDLDPVFPKAWMNRGITRYRRGERKLAAEDFQKAQSLDDNIILPDIDFFADTTPSAETTAQPSGSDVWKTVLDAAEKELMNRGATDIKLVAEHPSFQCAEYSAIIDNKAWRILVSCGPDGRDSLTLPAVSKSNEADEIDTALVALLILNLDAANGRPSIGRFEKPWSFSGTATDSVIQRYRVPPASRRLHQVDPPRIVY
jgi:tetratricopeptide (TPR) repeat protein